MPFDFELLFTGLCLFTFVPDRQDPEEVNVLLVNTNHLHGDAARGGNGSGHNGHHHVAHEPVLTYALNVLTDRSEKVHQVFPGPDGEPIGRRRLDLPQRIPKLALVPPEGAAEKPTVIWRPAADAGVQVPRNPDDERWLDWALRLARLFPTVPAPNGNAFAGLDRDLVSTSTRVRLTTGTLQAARVARGLNGGYVLWHFVDSDNNFDRRESQALAGSIVLRLEGLTAPVQIAGFGGLVEFAPPRGAGGGLVQVSITNFPPEEVDERDRLDHVTQEYSNLVPGVDHAAMRFPTNADHLDTPSSTLCPPGTH